MAMVRWSAKKQLPPRVERPWWGAARGRTRVSAPKPEVVLARCLELLEGHVGLADDALVNREPGLVTRSDRQP